MNTDMNINQMSRRLVTFLCPCEQLSMQAHMETQSKSHTHADMLVEVALESGCAAPRLPSYVRGHASEIRLRSGNNRQH